MTAKDLYSPKMPLRDAYLGQGVVQGVRRRVYLAGPFTGIAQRSSPADGVVSGIIGPGSPWRRTLEAAERALAGRGWRVFLPHREVSKWGHREVPPEQIAHECLEAVLGSDLVLAVMAESFGTHVEVGTAIGRGIPIVVIEAEDESSSFFGSAVAACELVTSMRLRNLRDLPEVIAGDGFDDVVHNAFHRQGVQRDSYEGGLKPPSTWESQRIPRSP